ncbi:MAG: FadR/GntR family transcriptional regulator [Bryobacter sp.]
MPTSRLLKPLKKETLVEQVSDRLIEMLVQGHWKQGEKLPSEPILAHQLGIGRSTLREAINALTFLGLLEVRRGEGTFVGQGSTRMIDRCLVSGLLRTDVEVEHLCEARLLLEGDLAARCARNISVGALEELAALEREMESRVELSPKEFTELDLNFHLRIAEASGNPVLEQLFRTTRGLLQEWILRSQQNAAARALAQAGHTGILESLRAGNAQLAREAMEQHLRDSFNLMRENV